MITIITTITIITSTCFDDARGWRPDRVCSASSSRMLPKRVGSSQVQTSLAPDKRAGIFMLVRLFYFSTNYSNKKCSRPLSMSPRRLTPPLCQPTPPIAFARFLPFAARTAFPACFRPNGLGASRAGSAWL